jgi:hypothetical protein
LTQLLLPCRQTPSRPPNLHSSQGTRRQPTCHCFKRARSPRVSQGSFIDITPPAATYMQTEKDPRQIAQGKQVPPQNQAAGSLCHRAPRRKEAM